MTSCCSPPPRPGAVCVADAGRRKRNIYLYSANLWLVVSFSPSVFDYNDVRWLVRLFVAGGYLTRLVLSRAVPFVVRCSYVFVSGASLMVVGGKRLALIR